MKRFLSILAALILAAGCATSATAALSVTPGTPVHNHSDANTGGGTLALSGKLSSTKACAGGYARVSPNMCIRTTAQSSMTLLTWLVCTAVAAPTGATALVLQLETDAVSVNSAVSTADSKIWLHDDASCATVIGQQYVRSMEYVATVAGNFIGIVDAHAVVPVVAGNAYIRLAGTSTAQGGYWVYGYYD